MSDGPQAAPAAGGVDTSSVLGTSTPLRFLVIEDSPTDAELLGELLTDELPHGELDVVPSLDQALRRLSASSYDLILADMSLPDADGERVVQAVRGAAPRTPLIVLTGRVDKDLALWSLSAGAQDYLVKGEHDGPRLADAVLRGLQRSLTEQQTHDRLISALKLQSEAAERLQALDAARNDFVATANHELRTPLASIAAYAELLQDTPGLDASQARFVDAIVRNAARLGALTDDLLLLTSFSSEQPTVETDPVDMCAVLTATKDGLSNLAAARGVTVTYRLPDTPDGPLHACGDRSQLERVVFSIVMNGIKFTPGPGTVTCTLEATDEDVVVTVTDTGVGIPADELDLVFDKFYRGAWAHEHATQGAGLGLYIAASVVERHHGRLSVESTGAGTTFTVRLPRLLARTDEWPDPAARPVDETLTTRLLSLLAHPDVDDEVRETASMLGAALRSSQQTDQWQLLTDALRFAHTRLQVRGWSDADLEPVAAALLEAARGTPAKGRWAPPPAPSTWIAGSTALPPTAPELSGVVVAYLHQLLRGDAAGAAAVVRTYLADGTDVLDVLVDVLEPAQHEVGRRWEVGSISVAQEHLCTAVTQQVLADLYAPVVHDRVAERRLVSVHAPGSLHHLGLDFVTHVLEAHGWRATHAAHDIDESGLISLLARHSADVLLISASMPAQVDPVRTLIQAVRDDPRTCGVKVVVGGRLFNISPDLADVVGADGWARDARSTLDVCRRLAEGEG